MRHRSASRGGTYHQHLFSIDYATGLSARHEITESDPLLALIFAFTIVIAATNYTAAAAVADGVFRLVKQILIGDEWQDWGQDGTLHPAGTVVDAMNRTYMNTIPNRDDPPGTLADFTARLDIVIPMVPWNAPKHIRALAAPRIFKGVEDVRVRWGLITDIITGGTAVAITTDPAVTHCRVSGIFDPSLNRMRFNWQGVMATGRDHAAKRGLRLKSGFESKTLEATAQTQEQESLAQEGLVIQQTLTIYDNNLRAEGFVNSVKWKRSSKDEIAFGHENELQTLNELLSGGYSTAGLPAGEIGRTFDLDGDLTGAFDAENANTFNALIDHDAGTTPEIGFQTLFLVPHNWVER